MDLAGVVAAGARGLERHPLDSCPVFAFCHLVRSPSMFARATAFASRWGLAPGRVAAEALAQWAQLWTLRNVALFTLLAALAYGIQAAVFAVLCTVLSLPLQPAVALEIFVNATLLGAASMVPGGLGTMEASLVFQLMAQGAEKADAVAIAIATRCVTLWCGVFIGLIAFTGVCMRTRPGKL
ncbi:lysylphosphatidylglycerol synthase domain-containing protein [Variovorax paradoxus]